MSQKDPFDSFDPRPFIKTLSYREFLTPFCLVLAHLSLISVFDYLFHGFYNWILLVSLCCLIILNHVFYKAEHLRSNNFIGRNLHDYIFLLIFVCLATVYNMVMGKSISFDMGFSVFVFFLSIFVIMLFEAFVSLCRRGLNLLGWQIL